jgi:hypothetical protein
MSSTAKPNAIKQHRTLWLAVAFAVALIAGSAGQAHARTAKLARAVSGDGAAAATADPGCCAPAPKCCPQPCITYLYRGCRKACSGCEPPVKTTLKVVNPCTCCAGEIPVCLPACCDGCPQISSRPGLLCQGVVHYDWCCGFSVTIRFDRCGDAVVIYRGV